MRKPKIQCHRFKDNDVKHLQTKNNTGGNFLISLLLTQINICRKSSKRTEKGRKLKDSILNKIPVPTNITEPRKLDEYYKDLLEENRAKRELTLDGALEKIQSKTLNIMRPLSKLWFRFEESWYSQILMILYSIWNSQ